MVRYFFSLSLLCSVALASEPVDFITQIQPILSENCFACHGPDEKSVEGKLRLDSREDALRGGESGAAIVAGDAEKSLLLRRVTSHVPDEIMPPHGKKEPLEEREITLLRDWINEGVAWGQHWAFTKPVRPELPVVNNKSWPKNAIDHFILAKLEAQNLSPSPPASDPQLLRRLSLDLIGLPPTIEEISQLENSSITAETERLLASPHYGERWGREWLDAARYADSSGYEKDLPRQMHFYRDWVVNAFNRNMAYDQFITQQIAGDLLPNASQDELVATGFLRNSMTNEEGGAKAEQFRIEGIFDRIDAIGKSMLGLTVQCAQCHTHKYDPIKHEDYYGFFAYLNSTREASAPAYTSSDQQKIASLKNQITILKNEYQISHPDWQKEFAAWQNALLALPRTKWEALELYQLGDSGQKYLPQPDRSIINMGYAASRSTEQFTSESKIPTVRSVRLELLNDPYLPLDGPGRSTNGTGALNDFKLLAGPTSDQLQPLALSDPYASLNPPERLLDSDRFPKDRQHSPENRRIGSVELLLDENSDTGWTNELHPGVNNDPQVLTFQLKTPLQNPGNLHFRFPLMQTLGGWNSDDTHTNNLGRLRLSLSQTLPNALDQLPPLVREALEIPTENRSAKQHDLLFSHWLDSENKDPVLSQKILALWLQHPLPTTALVMRKSEKPRPTHLFERGEQTQPKQLVQPHTPNFLHSLPSGDPTSRLTFAKWLASPESPTTARAYVNRVWQAYFGTGLLETSEDFGLQAARPSHPELLDWLAVEFMESGWDIKHLHGLITSSATYQQDSVTDSLLREKDPQNRLLARGARLRVPAETVRDIQLTSSGLLNPKMGGRAIYPPAPAFLFDKPASYGPKTWTEEKDEERYRRALYTFHFRSVTHPALLAFDSPTGDISCIRRNRSTTPLQALVTLNEQLSLESALGLARLFLDQPGSLEEKIATSFQRCTARQPKPYELKVLQDLYEGEKTRAQSDPSSVQKLIKQYQPVGVDLSKYTLPDLAAATAVARVLLNLDETITKN